MNFVDKDGTTKVYIPVHPWAIKAENCCCGDQCYGLLIVKCKACRQAEKASKSALSFEF